MLSVANKMVGTYVDYAYNVMYSLPTFTSWEAMTWVIYQGLTTIL